MSIAQSLKVLVYSNVSCNQSVVSVLSHTFTDEEIDGEGFLVLTEAEIKELVKPLGTVK